MSVPAYAAYDEATLNAFRALKDGKANDGQQKAAIEFVLFNLCRIRDVSFDTDNQRLSDFNEGRRFVGLQIAGMFDPKATEHTIEAKSKKRQPKRQSE